MDKDRARKILSLVIQKEKLEKQIESLVKGTSSTKSGGMTEERRKALSESLKKRWALTRSTSSKKATSKKRPAKKGVKSVKLAKSEGA